MSWGKLSLIMDHTKYKDSCHKLYQLVHKDSNKSQVIGILDNDPELQDYLASNVEYKRGVTGYPPLLQAANSGCLEIMTLLVEKYDVPLDAQWQIEDTNSKTSLHLAIASNKPEAVSLLLKYGADQTIGGIWNSKPFQNAKDLAQQQNHQHIIHILTRPKKGNKMLKSMPQLLILFEII